MKSTHIKIVVLVVLAVLFSAACSNDTELLEETLTDSTTTDQDEENDTVDSEGDEASDPTDSVYDFSDAVTTESLGWEANEDVTEKLEAYLLDPISNTLCLSHLYKLRDNGIEFPNNFTLCAELGAGFSLIDIQNSSRAFLEIGDNNLWYNVSILSEEPLAPEEEVKTNNKTAVLIRDGQDIRIVNCKFATNAKSHLDIRGVSNFTVKGSHFDYGFYQILLRASSSTILIEDCLFSNSYGDGVKTARNGKNGVENITVINTVFEYNGRDGLDTTGGFRNSLVTHCIFRNNGVSGMDIKSIYENPNDMGEDGTRGNDHIRITNSEFIDHNNAIVLTTLDRNDPKRITDENHAYYLPHDISVENCIIENNTAPTKKAFLIKDAHTISWDGLQLLGVIRLERTYGLVDPDNPSDASRPNLSVTNYNINGTNITTGPPRGISTGYPFAEIGPRLLP